MTSQSQSAALGSQRRPAPPRASAPAAHPLRPVTYVPETYDPRQAPAAAAVIPGQYGLVYPGRRTGRGVWLALLMIVVGVVAFLSWRVTRTGASPQPGIVYTSATGHFSDRFPAEPSEVTRGLHGMTLHAAVVPGAAMVAEAALPAAVKGRAGQHLDSVAAGYARAAGAPLSGIKKLSVQGGPAMQANYIDPTSGELRSILVLAPTDRRLYLIVAPTGPTFDTLKQSFVALP
jgi:hypothetical protein